MHPASLSDAHLLRDVIERRSRGSGPGGQHRNKTESAVRLRHVRLGVTAIGEDSRSQAENKLHAVRRLRAALPEEIAPYVDMTPDEVRDILKMSQMPISLEKPIGEEEDSSFGDFVEDESSPSPFHIATTTLRREDVERALSSLPKRERQVIEMRFGLNGKKPRTLEEVGQAFGVTRERIRQIENNTLKKLKSLPEAQPLRDCV